MFDEQEYKAVFSKVTASGETHRRILDMEYQDQKHHSTRLLTKVLVAAVMIALLSVTVAAAEFGWFVDYFSKESQSVLNGKQIEFIQERERSAQQSQTHDGYTITLETYFADSMSAWFKLKIQCPEGVQFCDSPWGTYPTSWHLIRISDGIDLGGGEIWRLEDPDRTDDVGYIQLHFIYQMLQSNMENLLSDPYYQLRIQGLQDIYLEEDEIVFNEVASGIWEYNIDLSDLENMEVEFIKEPVEYVMIADDYTEDPKKVPVKITSFRLYPMYAIIQYDYMDETKYGTPDNFEPCSVVFRDGSVVILETSAVGGGMTEFQTLIPLMLSEVDYIQLPDGTKLTAPQ